jgi:GMP synthase (glutamine-hydrolysing)
LGSTIGLRSITSDDFMTADWSRVPYEILAAASARITSEVEGITRVVYDITPKPPATVEWQ